MKTEILTIGGDDYSAMIAEEEIGIQHTYELAKENEGNYARIEHYDGFVATEIEARIYELEGDVDNKFISIVRNDFMDYDHAKGSNFYIFRNGKHEYI